MPTWRFRPDTYGLRTRFGIVSTTTKETTAKAVGNQMTPS